MPPPPYSSYEEYADGVPTAPIPQQTSSTFDAAVVALLLSMLAGLSTCLGGALVLIAHPLDSSVLALGLAIATSAMCTVSIFDLFLGAVSEVGFLPAVVSLLLGSVSFYLVQKMIPKSISEGNGVGTMMSSMGNNNNNNSNNNSEREDKHPNGIITATGRRMWRLAVLNAITLTLHNFPEGMAVAVSTMSSTAMGVKMTFALALHNIPEGLCIALPAVASGEVTWRRAMILTALSGLSEPVGAFLTVVFFHPFLSAETINYALSFVGGIMLHVALTELFPEGLRQDRPMFLAVGLAVGTVLMLVSLIMLS